MKRSNAVPLPLPEPFAPPKPLRPDIAGMMRQLRAKDDAKVTEYQGQRVRLSDEDLARIDGYLKHAGGLGCVGYESEHPTYSPHAPDMPMCLECRRFQVQTPIIQCGHPIEHMEGYR